MSGWLGSRSDSLLILAGEAAMECSIRTRYHYWLNEPGRQPKKWVNTPFGCGQIDQIVV
jgi:hypothetical protein